MEKGKATGLFESRMADKLAKDADLKAFDPMIIITILTAILPMILDCFKRSRGKLAPAALRQRLFKIAPVAAAIRRQDSSVGWAESRKMAMACFDVADESSDDEINAFVTDCCE